MYAIIEDSGRQFKVSTGDRLYVDVRDLTEGQDKLEFERVLMLGEGAEAKIGQPILAGAKVVATIDGERKGRKLEVRKFRRRKNYRRKTGHRQNYLQVTVSEIVG